MLRPLESGAEADFLSRSAYAEVRLRALQSGELSLWRVKQMRRKDVNKAVRLLAFELLAKHLTRTGAWFLSFNKYGDVRRRAVSSGKLSARRLLRLSERDSDESVRRTAWQILNRDLPAEEAEALLSSDNLERRAWAVLCESIPRQRLLELCAEDWQAEARAAALERLRRDLTADEVEVLSRSHFAEVSLFAAGSTRLSRSRLSEMCVGAPQGPVRRAAWDRLSNDLTPEEADALSRSRYGDMRANAVDSGLLSEKRLAQLARDPAWQVRRAVGEQRASRPAST
jgi:hypothetical protein